MYPKIPGEKLGGQKQDLHDLRIFPKILIVRAKKRSGNVSPLKLI